MPHFLILEQELGSILSFRKELRKKVAYAEWRNVSQEKLLDPAF